MGKKYVIDPETLEATDSDREDKTHNESREPFVKYVNTTDKEVPDEASNLEILDILSEGEVGFIKLEERAKGHEFLFQGINEEKTNSLLFRKNRKN